ncbi:prion-inhibition and propagation-domain-containing protein [Trichophaea hybrida]|nr:prion-inhibition and propagation-domain-containing protein [Trichophaea hybrida]
MEPAGLALGIAGLAGLWSTSLEVFDQISAAREYGEKYSMLVAQLEVERARFMLWGRDVGLSSSNDRVNERLQDPIVRQSVGEILGWIVHILQSSDVMKKRYSHGIIRRSSSHGIIRRGTKDSLRDSGATTPIVIPNIGKRAAETQKQASTMRKIIWSLFGMPKSQVLLQKLEWFIDKLHDLIPLAAVEVERNVSPLSEAAAVLNAAEKLRQSRPLGFPKTMQSIYLPLARTSSRPPVIRRQTIPYG